MRAFSPILSLPLVAALTLAAAAPAVAAPAAPAAAAGPKASPTAEDVRCLLTMVALSQNKSQPQAAQSGQVGIFFFAGRLSARAPGADLGPMMKTEASYLTGATVQAELKRCGALIQTAQSKVQGGLIALRPPAPPAGAAAPAGPAAAAAPAVATPKPVAPAAPAPK